MLKSVLHHLHKSLFARRIRIVPKIIGDYGVCVNSHDLLNPLVLACMASRYLKSCE